MPPATGAPSWPGAAKRKGTPERGAGGQGQGALGARPGTQEEGSGEAQGGGARSNQEEEEVGLTGPQPCRSIRLRSTPIPSASSSISAPGQIRLSRTVTNTVWGSISSAVRTQGPMATGSPSGRGVGSPEPSRTAKSLTSV